MEIQKTIYRGLGSLAFLATLALAAGSIAPSAFAQTTGSTTDMTSTTTEPTYCNTTASTQGYYVTTDMANYSQGQDINFCLVDDTPSPIFVQGTHPWEITDQNGNVVFTPDAGTLTSSTTGSYYFNDSWDGTDGSSTSVNPGTYNVVFNGYPNSPFATFTIGSMGSTSTSTGTTGSTTIGTGTSTTTTGTGTGDNTGSTTSSSTTSVDWTGLAAQIQSLEAQLSSLLQQLYAALGTNGNGGTTGGMPGSTNTSATIDQNGQTVAAGSTIDFSGRNFNHEENIGISLNESIIGNAHADGGGNFSTGSMTVPSTAGTYTYTFTGQSGDSAQATITVQ